MSQLENYISSLYHYSKDCSTLSSHFASCTMFWGVIYFIAAIISAFVFIKAAIYIYKEYQSPKFQYGANANFRRTRASEGSKTIGWQDSAFEEFSHERILQKFHKELNQE